MSRKRSNGERQSHRSLAEREQCVTDQQQLIAELKRKGRSTAQVEAELRKELLALTMLRNHFEVMTELTASPYENPVGEQSDQGSVAARNRDG